MVLEAVGGETLHQSIGLLGFSLLAWRAADPEQARADIRTLTGLFSTGELRAVTETLPLAEAARAHQLLEDRAVAGRLLLLTP